MIVSLYKTKKVITQEICHLYAPKGTLPGTGFSQPYQRAVMNGHRALVTTGLLGFRRHGAKMQKHLPLWKAGHLAVT
jgi:hypothetical protein